MPCTSDKDLEHSTTHLGFEAQLWLAADKLRNNVAPAEHKHVVLGIIFLDTPEAQKAEANRTRSILAIVFGDCLQWETTGVLPVNWSTCYESPRAAELPTRDA